MTEPLPRPARETSKPDMEAIIAEHGDRILRQCLMYLGNRSLAEDAFQETMIKCWQHYDTYRAEAPFAAWLKKIATMYAMISCGNAGFGYGERAKTQSRSMNFQ